MNIDIESQNELNQEDVMINNKEGFLSGKNPQESARDLSEDYQLTRATFNISHKETFMQSSSNQSPNTSKALIPSKESNHIIIYTKKVLNSLALLAKGHTDELEQDGIFRQGVIDLANNKKPQQIVKKIKEIKKSQDLEQYYAERYSEEGFTLLHYIAHQGNYPLYAQLENKAVDEELLSNNKLQPSHIAALNGQVDFVLSFLKNENQLLHLTKVENTELDEVSLAIMGNQPEAVEILLSQAKLANSPFIHDFGSLLHLAVYANNERMIKAVLWGQYKDEATLQSILMKQDKNGRTPLALAAVEKKLVALDYLLDLCRYEVEKIEELGLIRDAFYQAVEHKQRKVVEHFLAFGFMPQAGHNKYNELVPLLKNGDIRAKKLYKLINDTVKRGYFKEKRKPEPLAQQYENLVFQGGGMKGAIYPYALKAFLAVCKKRQADSFSDEKNYLGSDNIKRVLGTSAGAIFALLYALNVDEETLSKEMSRDFSEFLEDRSELATFMQFKHTGLVDKILVLLGNLNIDMSKSSKFYEEVTKTSPSQSLFGQLSHNTSKAKYAASNISSVFQEVKTAYKRVQELNKDFKGFVSGTAIYNWLKGFLTQQGLDEHLTFGEWADRVRDNKQFKHLHIVVTCLETELPIVLSSENEVYKDYLIIDAVRASMSLPFVFEPAELRIKLRSGQIGPEPARYTYIDGGLIRNYAINEFDYKRYVDNDEAGDASYHDFNPKTLGFKFKAQAVKDEGEVKTVIAFVKKVTSIFYNAEDSLQKTQDTSYGRTIELDTKDITTMTFRELTENDNKNLQTAAEQAVNEYFGMQQLDLEPMEDDYEEDRDSVASAPSAFM